MPMQYILSTTRAYLCVIADKHFLIDPHSIVKASLTGTPLSQKVYTYRAGTSQKASMCDLIFKHLHDGLSAFTEHVENHFATFVW